MRNSETRACAALAALLALVAGCRFDSLYLSRRPAVGRVYTVALAGESYEARVLARTLQGIVNREIARLYLVDDSEDQNPSDLFWLELYEREYGVERAREGDLDDALARFAGEVTGFIVASQAEPWTVNAATTLAAVRGAVVGFESQRARLEAAGLEELESLVGRWSDGPECYRELALEHARMDHRGIAILAPGLDLPRDFLVQQGLLTVHAWPLTPEWSAVVEILGDIPENVPVYGYASRDGVEEFVAVAMFSVEGKFLVPTDTTPNLSFHVAVRAQPRRRPGWGRHAGRRPVRRVHPGRPACNPEEPNVSIAISDGDNMRMPIVRYTRDTYWNSAKRGRLPLGWSITPGLQVLAPAAAHYYRTSATPNDEWVALLGTGYAAPSLYPDRNFFFSTSFALMRRVGMRVFWTLDPMVYFPNPDPDSPFADVWRDFAAAARGGIPLGVLGGYGPDPLFSLETRAYVAEERWPVLLASGDYPDTPEVLASRIEALASLDPPARPPVTFLSAAVWNNSLDGLVDALAPLEARGVRFLLPSEALACVEQLAEGIGDRSGVFAGSEK